MAEHLTEQEIARRKAICKRFAVSWQTVVNWIARGKEIGTPPPVDSPVGNDLLVWYRGAYGREPVNKLKARIAAEQEAERVPVGAEAIIDVTPVRVIKAALERLGLSLTIARLIEEDERCWSEYKLAQRNGDPTDALRRRWSSITEEKRKTQASKDAVALALELFREWARGELEADEQARRQRLSGKACGLTAKARLSSARTDAEWIKIWDQCVDEALADDELTHPGHKP